MSLANFVTIGQFVPLDTPIHRLDPRVKLLLSLILLIFIFIIGKLLPLLVLFVLAMVCAVLAKVPLMHLVRGMRPILILIVLTVVIQLFSTSGEPLLSFWGLTITKEGILVSLFVVLRLILLVSISVILTYATSPLDLTFALESFMLPLKRIGFPASEIALMMSIALRFIPTLLEETDKIIKAQTSRGADFSSGGIIARAKSFIPVLIPLFVSAFRRADELADAMESRCFITGEKRSRLHVPKLGLNDFVAVVSCVIAMAGVYVWSIL
ncbi:MAG: energy-coupling factor transporter transmembrane component T [Caldisericales bacterium]|jgi:energy-coupling factor transport system permease protein|nr:energy-coupling factor transporter transmembrane protein EcfT [bacterium]